MIDAQTRYALARARVELALAELREALDRHEKARRWDEHEILERVERGLGDLVNVIAENKATPAPPPH